MTAVVEAYNQNGSDRGGMKINHMKIWQKRHITE
jgi:hypothetical protein